MREGTERLQLKWFAYVGILAAVVPVPSRLLTGTLLGEG